MLFKAYVMPVMSYACEALPFTKTKIDALNKIIIRYCRWALNVPKNSNRLHTLRECGLRPFEYVYRAAKANYYLLLQSRPLNHLTTYALLHIMNNKRSALYKKWLCPVIEDLRKWDLYFNNGLPCNSFVYKKNVFSARIRSNCDNEFNDIIHNTSTQEKQINMHEKLFDVDDNGYISISPESMQIRGHPYNLIHSPNTIIYPLMILKKSACECT